MVKSKTIHEPGNKTVADTTRGEDARTRHLSRVEQTLATPSTSPKFLSGVASATVVFNGTERRCSIAFRFLPVTPAPPKRRDRALANHSWLPPLAEKCRYFYFAGSLR